MANFLDSTSNYVSDALNEYGGQPLSIVSKLANGDRVGAITALLGDTVDAEPPDWRVRLSVAPAATYLYQDLEQNSLMAPLQTTRGCVWPYTPNVSMSYNATYQRNSPTHSNYPVQSYHYSQVSTINISGDFTAQNAQEAKYLLACMMFLRASTKMFWGESPQAGMPPPILYLNGYGKHFFPNVPVVITDYTANLPDDVDYIEVLNDDQTINNSRRSTENDVTRIPASVTMTVSCEPIYSRTQLTKFSFEKFARGELLGDNTTTNGGFKGGFV